MSVKWAHRHQGASGINRGRSLACLADTKPLMKIGKETAGNRETKKDIAIDMGEVD